MILECGAQHVTDDSVQGDFNDVETLGYCGGEGVKEGTKPARTNYLPPPSRLTEGWSVPSRLVQTTSTGQCGRSNLDVQRLTSIKPPHSPKAGVVHVILDNIPNRRRSFSPGGHILIRPLYSLMGTESTSHGPHRSKVTKVSGRV